MRISTKVPAEINLTRYLGGRTTKVNKKKNCLLYSQGLATLMNIEGLVQKDDPRRKADTPRGEAVRRESPNKSSSAIKPASPKRVLQGTLGKK